MLRGRPHASGMRQVECYLKDTGMAGMASAWAMARGRQKEYRRKVRRKVLRRIPPYLT